MTSTLSPPPKAAGATRRIGCHSSCFDHEHGNGHSRACCTTRECPMGCITHWRTITDKRKKLYSVLMITRGMVNNFANSCELRELWRSDPELAMDLNEEDISLDMARSAVNGYIEALVEYEHREPPPQEVVLEYLNKAIKRENTREQE